MTISNWSEAIVSPRPCPSGSYASCWSSEMIASIKWQAWRLQKPNSDAVGPWKKIFLGFTCPSGRQCMDVPQTLRIGFQELLHGVTFRSLQSACMLSADIPVMPAFEISLSFRFSRFSCAIPLKIDLKASSSTFAFNSCRQGNSSAIVPNPTSPCGHKQHRLP